MKAPASLVGAAERLRAREVSSLELGGLRRRFAAPLAGPLVFEADDPDFARAAAVASSFGLVVGRVARVRFERALGIGSPIWRVVSEFPGDYSASGLVLSAELFRAWGEP